MSSATRTRPPLVGETPFFLGIKHNYSIRTRQDTTAALLVLSAEDGVALQTSFPEDWEQIVVNLLSVFGLDVHGNDIAVLGDETDANDTEKGELRDQIVESIRRRAVQRFIKLIQDTDAGDVEAVMIASRQGADLNQADHDGRRVIHMAATEGNYKMVEMLLENGADKNVKDRSALLHRHCFSCSISYLRFFQMGPDASGRCHYL